MAKKKMINEPLQPRKLSTLKKLQLFFIFLLLITGIIWIFNGPVATPEQKRSRLVVAGAETAGLVVVTLLVMRKRSEK